MIISDGVTSLTFAGTMSSDFQQVEIARKISSSGIIKQQTAGKRFITTEQVRMTGDEWQALATLLVNGSTAYYYTPTITPDYLTAGDFPMKVYIEPPQKTGQAGGGGKKYYADINITSINFI